MTGAAPLGARRHRITLMSEVREMGAGGRAISSAPIIADVWAQAEADLATGQMAGGQKAQASVRFVLHFDASYLATKLVDWNGARYRVQSLKAVGTNVRRIEITAHQTV